MQSKDHYIQRTARGYAVKFHKDGQTENIFSFQFDLRASVISKFEGHTKSKNILKWQLYYQTVFRFRFYITNSLLNRVYLFILFYFFKHNFYLVEKRLDL